MTRSRLDQRNLLVYPNPAEGEDVTVKFGEGWSQPNVVLYDLNGRPVRSVNGQATAGGQVRLAWATSPQVSTW